MGLSADRGSWGSNMAGAEIENPDDVFSKFVLDFSKLQRVDCSLPRTEDRGRGTVERRGLAFFRCVHLQVGRTPDFLGTRSSAKYLLQHMICLASSFCRFSQTFRPLPKLPLGFERYCRVRCHRHCCRGMCTTRAFCTAASVASRG